MLEHLLQTGGHRFRVQKAGEEGDEDAPFFEDKSDIRFEKVGNGAHYMCPVNCYLYHFRHIHKSDPVSGTTIDLLRVRIRRANLDLLWAREAGSVYGNLREWRRALVEVARQRVEDSSPFASGPFPVKNTVGMALACTIAGCAGKHSETRLSSTLCASIELITQTMSIR
jgi:hypothetical protein